MSYAGGLCWKRCGRCDRCGVGVTCVQGRPHAGTMGCFGANRGRRGHVVHVDAALAARRHCSRRYSPLVRLRLRAPGWSCTASDLTSHARVCRAWRCCVHTLSSLRLSLVCVVSLSPMRCMVVARRGAARPSIHHGTRTAQNTRRVVTKLLRR